ncbi:hypothetical protein QUB37_13145 [Microcoleus sp. AT3-A2]|uniref:hypothetical protein n=1 Tax=unclassified Microcoleus TaxID=2642155 RepID=UPI002FCEC87A
MIVEKNAENFQEDILSKRLNILSRIKDRKIVKLVRFQSVPPAVGFNRHEHSPSAEFSHGNGPILMTLDSGLVVGIAYIIEKISLSLWIERTEAGEPRKGARPTVKNPTQFLPIAENPKLFPIDSRDPIFSDSKIDLLLGKQINKITLVKKEITDIKQSKYLSYKALYLPKEIGLILELETEFELIFSGGLDGETGGVNIIEKEEISPRPYEAFHYIPLDAFGTVEASSISEAATQLPTFSESKTPSPEQEELQLPAQLWEQIPIRVNRNLRRRKVRIDCQVDIFGLPAEVFIEVGEGITLKDLQIEHLLAARVMFSYAEIVQLIHKNRQELHDCMKCEERPDFDDDHLFWRVQKVLDNMCRNIREEIPQLAFQSQLDRQELEDHLDYFYALKQGLELCRELFIEIALTPDREDAD